MNRPGPATPQAGETELLEQAISYALAATDAITPDLLSRPTPCGDWNLRMLLLHATESLGALDQGIGTGCVDLRPAPGDGHPAADPAQAFRHLAGRLLAVRSRDGRPYQVIAIGGWPLPASILAGAGALEIAVHGWDMSQACGLRQPIPRVLATALLRLSPLLVAESSRRPMFAAPVAVPPTAEPSDRLTAFLGRIPDRDAKPKAGTSPVRRAPTGN
jgi:uncharacterized protein (TIGR03086 family)